MANFLLVYNCGGAPPASDAERIKLMNTWGALFGKLGPAVVDPGNPVSLKAKSISSDGSVHDVSADTGATGYSILKAASLSEGIELAKGCPVLKAGGKISVYEITPAM